MRIQNSELGGHSKMMSDEASVPVEVGILWYVALLDLVARQCERQIIVAREATGDGA
jgi:hypothetical protein